MRRRVKLGLLGVIFFLYTMLSGMICGKATEIAITVKDPTVVDISLAKALVEAKIPSQDGKIPDGIDKVVLMKHVIETNLRTDSRSKSTFERYGDKIHSIFISRITMAVEENTMSVDIPRITLSVAPFGTKNFEGPPIATFKTIAAGQTAENVTLVWEKEGDKKLIDVLKDFAIRVQVAAPIHVKGGMPYPIKDKGHLKIKMMIEITFVLNVI